MPTLLCLATMRGIHICERAQNDYRAIAHGLRDHRITSVTAREGVILAGSHDGVWRSDDFGKTWVAASDGLTTPYVRWLAFHPAFSDLEFAGTEPANIFVSHNGGASWRECGETAKLRDTNKWFLPYSSGAGCIRGFAFHGDRAYAAAEVGGALRSDDRGETWRLCAGSSGKPTLGTPHAGFIHPDVHSIVVHPSSPDSVCAPTGGGYYQSHDGGATWELKYACYVRAVWLDPHDAQHQILGPADSVDTNGRIEETHNDGATWHAASHDLPVPWQDHMVERFEQIDDELFAVLSNGQMLCAPIDNLRWQTILPDIANITAFAAMKV